MLTTRGGCGAKTKFMVGCKNFSKSNHVLLMFQPVFDRLLTICHSSALYALTIIISGICEIIIAKAYL